MPSKRKRGEGDHDQKAYTRKKLVATRNDLLCQHIRQQMKPARQNGVTRVRVFDEVLEEYAAIAGIRPATLLEIYKQQPDNGYLNALEDDRITLED